MQGAASGAALRPESARTHLAATRAWYLEGTYPPNRTARAVAAGSGQAWRPRRMECAGMAVVLLALILLVSSVALAVTGAGAPTGRRERR
jgi:hypothetical protein